MSGLLALISFVIIALASRQIGGYFSQVRLPFITGYLFAGMLVGPFVLNLIEAERVEELDYIQEVSLAVIAFVAGSEIFLKELQNRVRSIAFSVLGQVLAVSILGGLTVYFLTDYIPFTKDMPQSHQIAVALLASTILISRSPAAAVAVIKEMRAKGDFTKTVLGITVSMDVAIVTLFALNTPIAEALIRGGGLGGSFVIGLAVDLSADIIMGYLAGRLLVIILAARLPKEFKITLILALGYSIFWSAHQLADWSHDHLPVEIIIEPLLPAVLASFYVTNFSKYRVDLAELLDTIAPLVYVAFFTVTGIELDLDVLITTLPIALVLFAVRMVGITLGSYAGGILAKDPPHFNKLYWLTFISQAGIALGLTREAAAEFPELGNDFATMLIAVIVLNEIVGPLFLRYALRISGESNIDGEGLSARTALILGVEAQSLGLARQLKAHQWQVVMADKDPPQEIIDRQAEIGCTVRHIDGISEASIQSLITDNTAAVVAMMRFDDNNLEAIRLASQNYQIDRLIVRLNDPANTKAFTELGAMVVNPTDAMVNLLDQFVRAPQSASLFMHRDPTQEIIQVRVLDRDFDGVPLRDLRLPGDVLILGITRSGQSIVPHGFTTIQLQDEITLVGEPEQLRGVAIDMGTP